MAVRLLGGRPALAPGRNQGLDPKRGVAQAPFLANEVPEETQLAAAFVRDLTMRDRLRESRDRLAAIVETAPVILIACDTNGVVTLAEGKGLAKFDMTPETTVGQNVRDQGPHAGGGLCP